MEMKPIGTLIQKHQRQFTVCGIVVSYSIRTNNTFRLPPLSAPIADKNILWSVKTPPSKGPATLARPKTAPVKPNAIGRWCRGNV